jgi:hypothetical protein
MYLSRDGERSAAGEFVVATYIFCLICLAGAAYLCCCFIGLCCDGARSRRDHEVSLYRVAWLVITGSRSNVVTIRSGTRRAGPYSYNQETTSSSEPDVRTSNCNAS